MHGRPHGNNHRAFAAAAASFDGAHPRAALREEEEQARAGPPRLPQRVPVVPHHRPHLPLPGAPRRRRPAGHPDLRRQPRHRHALRLPEGARELLDPGELADAADGGGGAGHADARAAEGDGGGDGPDRPRVREAAAGEGPAAGAGAAGGAAVDDVLQREEDGVRGEAGGDRGGPQGDGGPPGRLHGGRGPTGLLRGRGGRWRDGLHAGPLRSGRGVQGLRDPLHGEPRWEHGARAQCFLREVGMREREYTFFRVM